MERWAYVALAAMVGGCSGGDDGTTDDSDGNGTDNTFECPVSEPFDLADPADGMVGVEHTCEDQPAYVEVSGATGYFAGEFHFDDCGHLKGTETWYLWANPTWVENGGQDCVVVWDLDGDKVDRVNKGDYAFDFAATVNLEATTCDEVDGGYSDGEKIYEGSENFVMVYDVQVDGDRSTVFWANGGSRDQAILGEGAANGNHVTYLAEFTCPFF